MSPECLQGNCSAKSDMQGPQAIHQKESVVLCLTFEFPWHRPRWSMGCVMYEMFANVLPFHLSGSMADADAHQALQFSCGRQLFTSFSCRMRGSSCTSRAQSGTSSDKPLEHLKTCLLLLIWRQSPTGEEVRTSRILGPHSLQRASSVCCQTRAKRNLSTDLA